MDTPKVDNQLSYKAFSKAMVSFKSVHEQQKGIMYIVKRITSKNTTKGKLYTSMGWNSTKYASPLHYTVMIIIPKENRFFDEKYC